MTSYISSVTIFAKIKVNSYDYLPIEKSLTLHNVAIFFKSVLDKDHDHYYYKIFSEKYSCNNNLIININNNLKIN